MTDRDGDGRGRIGRRRFLGSGLAAGAALFPWPAPAAAKSRPAAAAGRAGRLRAARSASSPLPQLPLRSIFPNLPAVPFDEPGVLDTLERLDIRSRQVTQAKQGLSHLYTLNGVTRRAYTFLFGGGSAAASRDARRALERSLREDPERARMEFVQRLGQPGDDAASRRGAPGPFSLDARSSFRSPGRRSPTSMRPGGRTCPAGRRR